MILAKEWKDFRKQVCSSPFYRRLQADVWCCPLIRPWIVLCPETLTYGSQSVTKKGKFFSFDSQSPETSNTVIDKNTRIVQLLSCDVTTKGPFTPSISGTLRWYEQCRSHWNSGVILLVSMRAVSLVSSKRWLFIHADALCKRGLRKPRLQQDVIRQCV